MLSSRGRFVLRLFGDGSTGQGLVFGEADVQQLFTSEPLRQSLRDLALKRSLLLCGFDAHDPDLAIAARLLSLAQTSGEGPQHFALLPGLPPGLRDELSRAYGLIVLDADSEEAVFAALHQSVGEIGSEILPDDDDLEGWLRLLQQEPEHQVATQKLADLEETLRGRGDHDRLIELFLGRMDIEKTPSGRARCLLQVASLFETVKGQLVEGQVIPFGASAEQRWQQQRHHSYAEPPPFPLRLHSASLSRQRSRAARIFDCDRGVMRQRRTSGSRPDYLQLR